MQAVRNSDSHPIYLNFIDYKWSESGNRMGITLAPGKYQPHGLTGSWERDLHKDLVKIKNEFKMDTIVSLLEVNEAANLKIAH